MDDGGLDGLELIAQNGKFAIASVTSDNQFARTLARFCGVQSRIDDLVFNPRIFSGGEYCPEAKPGAVAGKRIYLVATPNPENGTPQDLFGSILIATDALRRNGAREVWLVYTDMHYSRQDRGPDDTTEARKAEAEGIDQAVQHKMCGQPFTSMVQARHFKTAGIDRIVTVHPHSDKLFKIYGGAWLGIDEYDDEWNNPAWEEKLVSEGREWLLALDPAPIAAHYFLNNSSIHEEIKPDGSNLVFLVPDDGARPFTKMVKDYTFLPEAWLVQCDKIRAEPNDPSQVRVDIPEWPEGLSLKNKYIILCDDGSGTGGTLEKAAQGMRRLQYKRREKNIGEPIAVLAYITHPWLNGPHSEVVQRRLAGIKDMQEIIVGNTWSNIDDGRVVKFKERSTVLRFASFYAHAIVHCFETEMPLGDYFSFTDRKDLKQVAGLYSIKRSEMWGIDSASTYQRSTATKEFRVPPMKK